MAEINGKAQGKRAVNGNCVRRENTHRPKHRPVGDDIEFKE